MCPESGGPFDDASCSKAVAHGCALPSWCKFRLRIADDSGTASFLDGSAFIVPNLPEADFWRAWLRIRLGVTPACLSSAQDRWQALQENPTSHKPRPDPHCFGRMRKLVVTFQAFGSAD
jgi:hypothetical protein